MTRTLTPGALLLAPATLPASPPPRRWHRRGPWQPAAAQLAAARALALEIASALTYTVDKFEYVARQGLTIRDWLTGAHTEAMMAARYAAARQVLVNVLRRGGEWTPDPPQVVEAAARYARFLLGE